MSLLPLRSFIRELVIWAPLCMVLGSTIGSAVALFLWLLDLVTRLHWQQPELLWGLPIAGILSGLMYQRWGQASAAGNDLIIAEIQSPEHGVPGAMAPLVLIGTLLTHLTGGSAGREGTAVQIGGSVASVISRRFRLCPQRSQAMLSCGAAAGFSAVFGTPLAGTIFALEMTGIGLIRLSALIPCLVSALLADLVTTAWGIPHTHYVISTMNSTGSESLLKVALAGVCFGLAGRLFAALALLVHSNAAKLCSRAWLRPCFGGCLVIMLTLLTGRNDFLGLGVESSPATPESVSIVSSFQPGGADAFSWLGKMIFTTITVGCGFKGGEVTPLFYIGSTLGNILSVPLDLAPDVLAAVGFVAVFAAATNTPVACVLMGCELFLPWSPGLAATDFLQQLAVGCFTAWLFSGSRGIYQAQQPGSPKFPVPEFTK